MQPVSVTPEEDTPRAAFGLLPWRVNLIVVVLLIALSAFAWRSTVGQSFSMRSMAMGLGQIGWLSQGYMSASVFLAMWMTMMVADTFSSGRRWACGPSLSTRPSLR